MCLFIYLFIYLSIYLYNNPYILIGSKIILVESGTEKLKRAHSNLLRAQAETKNILTPILLRMSKSKKIKSADIALQSISVLLSFPHSMKIALNLGHYEDVLTISKKIQLLSPGNVLSSAKILIQVQLTASLIVEELKTKCLNVFLGFKRNGIDKDKDKDNMKDSYDDNSDDDDDDNNNNNNIKNNNNNNNNENFNNNLKNIPQISILTRYSILLHEMDGEEKQKLHLKSCFYKQLTLFGEEIQKYRKNYHENLIEAIKEGKRIFELETEEKKNPRNRRKNSNRNGSNKDKDNNDDDDDNSWFTGLYGTNNNSNANSKTNSLVIVNPSKKNSINDGDQEKNNNFSITDFEGKNSRDGLESNWVPQGISKNERLILKNCMVGKKVGREGGRKREMGRKVEKRGGDGMYDNEKIYLEFGLSDDDDDDDDNNNDNDNNNNNETENDDELQNNEKNNSNSNSNSNGNENGIGTEGGSSGKKRRGGIFLLEETKDHYYCDLFCTRVRLLYVLRVVRATEAWIPVLAQ